MLCTIQDCSIEALSLATFFVTIDELTKQSQILTQKKILDNTLAKYFKHNCIEIPRKKQGLSILWEKWILTKNTISALCTMYWPVEPNWEVHWQRRRSPYLPSGTLKRCNTESIITDKHNIKYLSAIRPASYDLTLHWISKSDQTYSFSCPIFTRCTLICLHSDCNWHWNCPFLPPNLPNWMSL